MRVRCSARRNTFGENSHRASTRNARRGIASETALVERLEGRSLLSTTAASAEDLVVLRPAITEVANWDAPPASSGSRAVTLPGFQIEVVFPDNTLSASQKAVFTSAAARWQSVFLGDVPNATGNFGNGLETIDDIRISATGPQIDGRGGILGQAGPDETRSGNGLPITGVMEFDSEDLVDLQNSGQLDEVILHEMGHVLGFGTIWSSTRNLLTGGASNPRFTGALATAQYQAIFGVTTTSVPVENSGGSGTRNSHWRESGGAGVAFDKELMTGTLDSGVVPLSRVTIAQFADLGYPSINLNAFDVFNPTDGGNAYPTITSLSDGGSATPVDAGFILTANGVNDADGSVSSVRFYRETNGITGLQVLAGTVGDVPGDLVVSTDTTPADGFTAAVTTTGMPIGTYTYYAQAADNQSLVSLNVSATHTIVAGASPALLSISVNDGAVQRSELTSLTLTFDKPVTLSAGALSLSRLNTGGSGTNDEAPPTSASGVLTAPTSLDAGRSWRYTFGGGGPFLQAGGGGSIDSLADGIYTASVDPSKVSASGTAAVTGGSVTFHRLFGDVNGDSTISPPDFLQFRNAFGKEVGETGYDAGFDFDGDGTINPVDYLQFRTRFGKVFTY